ncbi:MAG: helix-turn-helix domain-containing protein [Phycicoccus sp.]
MVNPYGDIELGATGMRALAHPVRVRVLGELQRHGPSTATRLSPLVGATPSVTSWHLRHLAEHGLVRDAAARGSGRERWWEAASRGVRYSPSSPAARDAHRALRRAMEESDGDLLGDWERDVEPGLPDAWVGVSGRSSTRVLVTIEEAASIEAAIEELLAPYVLRKDDPSAAPGSARSVRLVRLTLPEAAPSDAGGDPRG